jgi:hypothetical protein
MNHVPFIRRKQAADMNCCSAKKLKDDINISAAPHDKKSNRMTVVRFNAC